MLLIVATWLILGILIGIPMGKASLKIHYAFKKGLPYNKFLDKLLFPAKLQSGMGKIFLTIGLTIVVAQLGNKNMFLSMSPFGLRGLL